MTTNKTVFVTDNLVATNHVSGTILQPRESTQQLPQTYEYMYVHIYVSTFVWIGVWLLEGVNATERTLWNFYFFKGIYVRMLQATTCSPDIRLCEDMPTLT